MHRFDISSEGRIFDGLDNAQIVFHGINKSGSLALSKVLGEALGHCGRGGEFYCHYLRKETYDEFRELVNSGLGRSFVVGHSLYGALSPKANRIWVTQFRHPLPRAMSVYSWLQRKHLREHKDITGFPDFISFVRETRGISHSQVVQLGNPQGRYRISRSSRMARRDLYEASVDAMERDVYIVGISERFEETVFLFSAAAGVDSVMCWTMDLRNPDRRRVNDFSAEEIAVVEEFLEYDLLLYEYAVAKFERQNRSVRFGPDLVGYKDACIDQYKDRLLPEVRAGVGVSS